MEFTEYDDIHVHYTLSTVQIAMLTGFCYRVTYTNHHHFSRNSPTVGHRPLPEIATTTGLAQIASNWFPQSLPGCRSTWCELPVLYLSVRDHYSRTLRPYRLFVLRAMCPAHLSKLSHSLGCRLLWFICKFTYSRLDLEEKLRVM